ncbi:MAG: hypothetical protein ACK4MV_05275 [Beijerinckiaceae bacterium]
MTPANKCAAKASRDWEAEVIYLFPGSLARASAGEWRGANRDWSSTAQ